MKPIDRDAILESLRRLAGSTSRVLIIDDDEKDRYLLKHRLRATGMEVVEAASGAEGLKKAFAGLPKLIFLDLSMPGMSGYEVLDALKADSRTASIAVVVHTSLKLGEEEKQRLHGGAAAIVYKDQTGQELGLDILIEKMGESGKLLTQK
jgi:CheY-like chemotaxis protein